MTLVSNRAANSAVSWIDLKAIRRLHIYAATALLLIALAYWLWLGLGQRSIVEDDNITILASQGILEHGYMKLPAGYTYHRAFIPHYLLAGVFGVLGVTEFSISLAGIVFGLGSLWLTYLLGRRVFGKPWVGVGAVALLVLLQMEAFFATSPRMYMPFQFLTLLTVYSSWRGYINGEDKFKIIAFIAIVAAILSHTQGVLLAIAVPIAITVTLWVSKRQLPPIFSLTTIAGTIFVALAAWFVIIYQPPNPVPVITSSVGSAQSSVLGLNLYLLSWARESLSPTRMIVYILAFTPGLLLLCSRLVLGRRYKLDHGILFTIIIVTCCAALVLVGTTRTQNRLWFFIVPLYTLLISLVIGGVVEITLRKVAARITTNSSRRITIALATTAGFALILVAGLSFLAPNSPTGIVTKAIGVACNGWNCDKSIKEHHYTILEHIRPDDVIVSSNGLVTVHYIGRLDGVLKEKVIFDKHGNPTRFDELNDEYVGVPVLDASNLEELLDGNKRVWVLTDPKLIWHSVEETRTFLEDNYEEFLSDDIMTTYVYCPGQPCSEYDAN